MEEFLVVGNEELGSTVKEGDTVKWQNLTGTVKNLVTDQSELRLQFIDVDDKSYLVGIDGKLLSECEAVK